jgi:hypothetical protein
MLRIRHACAASPHTVERWDLAQPEYPKGSEEEIQLELSP